jgi:hypothetical protein
MALAALLWAVIAAEPDPIGPVDMIWSLPFAWLLPFLRVPARTPQWVLLSLGLIPLLLVYAATAALESDPDVVGHMSVAFYAALATFVAGHHGLEAAWRYRFGPWVRRGVLAAVGVAAAAIPFAIWANATSPAILALLMAAMTLLVLVERTFVLGWEDRWLRDRVFHWGGLPAFFFAVIIDEEQRQAGAYLLGGSLWLMGGVALGVMAALRRERRQGAYA